MTKEEYEKQIKSIKSQIVSLEFDKKMKAEKGCGSCDHGNCEMCAEQEYGEQIRMYKDYLAYKEDELVNYEKGNIEDIRQTWIERGYNDLLGKIGNIIDNNQDNDTIILEVKKLIK